MSVGRPATGMLEPLTIGLVAPIFNNLPVWAADRLGYFHEAGLEVSVRVLFGVQNVTTALKDGSIDVGLGTPESVLGDRSEPALRIIGGNARTLANGLIARREIRSIADLRGRTIGVSHPREGTALLVTEMLGRHGLSAGRDYEIRAVGVASERWKAIQRGELDGGLQTPPHRYIAEDLGYPNLGDIADYVPDYQFTTVNVRATSITHHPQALSAVLSALSRATRWMTEQPAAAGALATEVLDTTPDYARRDYAHFAATHSLTPDLKLSEAGMAKVLSVMRAAGTLPDDVDPEARIDLSLLPT